MTADWIALILQAIGGALADTASTEDGMNGGTHILVAGLSFQVHTWLDTVYNDGRRIHLQNKGGEKPKTGSQLGSRRR